MIIMYNITIILWLFFIGAYDKLFLVKSILTTVFLSTKR